jgi:hypothetical protein
VGVVVTSRFQPLLLRLARRLPPLLLEEPWALFIKGACVLSGASYLAQLGTAGSIQQLLPRPVVLLWNVDLLLGGALGLAGLLNRERRRRVEVAGLLLLGASTAVYAIAIVAVAGRRGIVPALLVGSFGAAAYLRALGVWAAAAVISQRAPDAE